MTWRNLAVLLFLCAIASLIPIDQCARAADPVEAEFPPELVDFVPDPQNPVFLAAGPGTWEARIRERGWILRDAQGYHLWFTGYDGTRAGLKMLGYATSPDGRTWTRYPQNPIYRDHWVEDMMVVLHEGTYYMFAEGLHDEAQLLTSTDGINWTRRGKLDVRLTNGEPISPGPYGTPTAWLEDGTWNLFYERMDRGVWLARSTDLATWTNVRDEPVLVPGPAEYDQHMIAVNQVVKHKDRYYAYYHGTGTPEPRKWCTCVAVSLDLTHWTKYPRNPILADNKSSGILVHDGSVYRLYTMHDTVQVHFPRGR